MKGVSFLDTRVLARKLAQGDIDEKKGAHYFLANNILWTLMLYYGMFFNVEASWSIFFETVIILVITIFGLHRSFDANGGSEGRDFVLRATCLIFVIGIKITALSIALGWVAYFVLPMLIDPVIFKDPARVYSLIIFLWSPIFTALLFWRLRLHITAIIRQTS